MGRALTANMHGHFDHKHGAFTARDPLQEVAVLATEAGAYQIAAEARGLKVKSPDRVQGLCKRLATHLREMQLALVRSADDSKRAITAIETLRILVDIVIDHRTAKIEQDHDALARWLEVECRKFMMANAADAQLTLDERLASTTKPHTIAMAHVQAITEAHLAPLAERLQTEVSNRLVLAGQGLLADVEQALGKLGEGLPLDTMGGVNVALRLSLCGGASARRPGMLASLGLVTRRRVSQSARDELVSAFDRGCRQLARRALDSYEDARDALDRQLFTIIDATLETARFAADFAAAARVDDIDGVARARSRVDGWSRALWLVMGQVEAHR